jgi:integrase
VRFHDLRHTFGTRMAAAGAPLRTLQEWMGHRDFKTTLIYADCQPSECEAEFVERAFRTFGSPPARQQELVESSDSS